MNLGLSEYQLKLLLHVMFTGYIAHPEIKMFLIIHKEKIIEKTGKFFRIIKLFFNPNNERYK